MATGLPEAATIQETEAQWFLWPLQVDWIFYLKMLRLRGQRSIPRLIYLDGSLFLMTPSLTHETLKVRLDRLVTEVVAGLSIPCRPAGQTTWKRRSKECGVEGDLTYYIASEPQIRGKREVNLRRDPPPDLAIEVVYKHGAKEALEVYRRLRVPEVWLAYEQGFEILHLGRAGRRYRYVSAERSLAFPFLTAAEIADWIGRPWDDETQWLLNLRRWVHETLAPRSAESNPDT